jgi:hypothetical protein
MENTHQKSSAEFKILDGQKTDFNMIFANVGYVFNKALELFKKDTTNFVLAFAIPVVVGGLLTVIAAPLLLAGLYRGGIGGFATAMSLFALVAFVLSLVAYIALLKAIVDVSKGTKFQLMDLFKFGFVQLINFIILGFKVLFTIFTGLKNFVNAWLSSIYFVENGGNVDQAIKSSQQVAEGKTATVAWTVILVAIAASLAANILTMLWVGVFSVFSGPVAELGSYIMSALVGPLTIMCHYVLREELSKHGGHHAAPVHHTPTHHTAA